MTKPSINGLGLVTLSKSIETELITKQVMGSAYTIQSSTTKSLTKKSRSWESNLPSSFTFIAMLKLKLETDNQAFNQEGQEVARILRLLADRLENLDKLQECQQPLRDLNGNLVGYYKTWSDQDDQEERQVSSPYATWKNIENVVENALGEYPERLT